MTPINYRQGCQWMTRLKRGDTGLRLVLQHARA